MLDCCIPFQSFETFGNDVHFWRLLPTGMWLASEDLVIKPLGLSAKRFPLFNAIPQFGNKAGPRPIIHQVRVLAYFQLFDTFETKNLIYIWTPNNILMFWINRTPDTSVFTLLKHLWAPKPKYAVKRPTWTLRDLTWNWRGRISLPIMLASLCFESPNCDNRRHLEPCPITPRRISFHQWHLSFSSEQTGPWSHSCEKVRP